MRRYKYKKIYSWNSELAYLSGVIASDGNLSKNRRHINITSKDIEMLNNAKTILEISSVPKPKPNGFGGVGYYLQFGNVALYDFLYDAGLTPVKSKTILMVDVPDKFFSDFLRGLFDGDGTIYGYWDKRWSNSLMFYVEFTSASPAFLEWLRSKNQELIGVKGGKIKSGIRASKLSYAKKDSKALYRFMYYSPNVISLSRKRVKFESFLASDPYHDVLGRVAESVDAPD